MPVSHEDVRQLTKAEWEERLTPEQFSVCREQCTEPVGVQSEPAVFYIMSPILTNVLEPKLMIALNHCNNSLQS